VLAVACARPVDHTDQPPSAGGGSTGGASISGSGGMPGSSSGPSIGGGGVASASGGGGASGAAGAGVMIGGAAGTGGVGGGAAGAGESGVAGADGTGGAAATIEYRYAKLVALSEVSGRAWASAAELQIVTANGTMLSRAAWLISADSAETVSESTPPTNAIDGNVMTYWHTQWSSTDDPGHPHELVIDLGSAVEITGFTYLPRQDVENGRIANYEFYVSEDGDDWGEPVASGTFPNGSALQQVTF
jgi:large repetitive protein